MIIRVNFGTGDSAAPNEFIADSGAGYSSEQGYGWIAQESLNSENPTAVDISNNTRDRNSGSDSVSDSLIHLQYPNDLVSPFAAKLVKTPAAWEYAVEDGQYEVTVGVGDPDFFDSNHAINVEGVSAISGFVPTGSVENGFLPLDGQAFATGTVTVDVTDGRLTVDAIGGENTKINYISIVEVSDV